MPAQATGSLSAPRCFGVWRTLLDFGQSLVDHVQYRIELGEDIAGIGTRGQQFPGLRDQLSNVPKLFLAGPRPLEDEQLAKVPDRPLLVVGGQNLAPLLGAIRPSGHRGKRPGAKATPGRSIRLAERA
jgi:hypothetical protein